MIQMRPCKAVVTIFKCQFNLIIYREMCSHLTPVMSSYDSFNSQKFQMQMCEIQSHIWKGEIERHLKFLLSLQYNGGEWNLIYAWRHLKYYNVTCLSRNNVLVTDDNPETSLWAVFFGNYFQPNKKPQWILLIVVDNPLKQEQCLRKDLLVLSF